jgi:hypothetical protein
VIALANLADAEPEHVARTVAGLVEPALAEPDVQARVTDPDPKRTAMLRAVLEDWGSGRASPRLGRGLTLGTKTARETRQRDRTAKALAAARELVYIGEDDLKGRGLERRGEPLRAVVYCALRGGETERRYRFYLNERGQATDFASEAVD